MNRYMLSDSTDFMFYYWTPITKLYFIVWFQFIHKVLINFTFKRSIIYAVMMNLYI